MFTVGALSSPRLLISNSIWTVSRVHPSCIRDPFRNIMARGDVIWWRPTRSASRIHWGTPCWVGMWHAEDPLDCIKDPFRNTMLGGDVAWCQLRGYFYRVIEEGMSCTTLLRLFYLAFCHVVSVLLSDHTKNWPYSMTSIRCYGVNCFLGLTRNPYVSYLWSLVCYDIFGHIIYPRIDNGSWKSWVDDRVRKCGLLVVWLAWCGKQNSCRSVCLARPGAAW